MAPNNVASALRSRRVRLRCQCWQALALFLSFGQVYTLAGMQAVPSNPANPALQRVKEEVSQVGIGGKLTVRKMDGTEYHGHLQAVEARTFSINEVDLKTVLNISYGDVDRVRKNYGGKGFGGKRVDPKRNLIFGTVFLGAFFTIIFVLLANDKS